MFESLGKIIYAMLCYAMLCYALLRHYCRDLLSPSLLSSALQCNAMQCHSGHEDYIGEPVSILDHSLQAGALAAEAKEDEEVRRSEGKRRNEKRCHIVSLFVPPMGW